MKIPGFQEISNISSLVPLLVRGVEALERMATALEHQNRLALQTIRPDLVDGLEEAR